MPALTEKAPTDYLKALFLGLPDDDMRAGRPRYRGEAIEADTDCKSCGGTGQPGFAIGRPSAGECSCVRYYADRNEPRQYKDHSNFLLKPKE